MTVTGIITAIIVGAIVGALVGWSCRAGSPSRSG